MNPLITVTSEDILHEVIDKMITFNVSMLPVVDKENQSRLTGILTYREIIEAYEIKRKEVDNKNIAISIKNKSIRIFVRGRRMIKR
jgi:CBS domain-containing protein